MQPYSTFDVQSAINENKQLYTVEGDEELVREDQVLSPKQTSPIVNNLNISIDLNDLQNKMGRVIASYLTDLHQNPVHEQFLFENMSIKLSEDLDEQQEQLVKEFESANKRKRIFKRIVDQLSLQMIESLRSIAESNSSCLISKNVEDSLIVLRQITPTSNDNVGTDSNPSSNDSPLTNEVLRSTLEKKNIEIRGLKLKVKSLEQQLYQSNLDQELNNLLSPCKESMKFNQKVQGQNQSEMVESQTTQKAENKQSQQVFNLQDSCHFK